MVNGGGKKLRKIDRDFDALRLRVVAAQPQRVVRNDALVVLLTSRTPGEGVSTVAAHLARSFARNGDGKVLLVDADEIANDIARKHAGNGMTMIDDPAKMVPGTPIGTVGSWGVDLLAFAGIGGHTFPYGPQWEDYFSALRARYDVIVVDVGSLKTKTPYFWAGSASQVLLVVDTTRTTIQALKRLRDDLKAAKLALTGIVLNKREFPIPQWLY